MKESLFCVYAHQQSNNAPNKASRFFFCCANSTPWSEKLDRAEQNSLFLQIMNEKFASNLLVVGITEAMPEQNSHKDLKCWSAGSHTLLKEPIFDFSNAENEKACWKFISTKTDVLLRCSRESVHKNNEECEAFALIHFERSQLWKS